METSRKSASQCKGFLLIVEKSTSDTCVVFDRVGGEVRSLAWDPRGERLAVLLKGFFVFLSIYTYFLRLACPAESVC